MYGSNRSNWPAAQQRPGRFGGISRRDPNDTITTPYYDQLPEEFKRAHPIEPGGGIKAPPRMGAPVILDDRRPTRASVQGFNRRSVGRRSCPPMFSSSEGQTCQSTCSSLGNPRTKSAFCGYSRSQPMASTRRVSGYSTASQPYTGPTPQELEADRKASLAYTHELYMRKPEWLKRMNPELPGGGYRVPPRLNAPIPRNDGPKRQISREEYQRSQRSLPQRRSLLEAVRQQSVRQRSSQFPSQTHRQRSVSHMRSQSLPIIRRF